MTRIVVTDSTSCLTMNGYQGDIEVIPFNLHIGDRTYKDGVDVSARGFIDIVRRNPELPLGTSPPTADEMFKLFATWRLQGVIEIFFVIVSSKLSLLSHVIREAAKFFEKDITVHIFDTRMSGTMVGELALQAQESVNQGLLASDIIERLDRARKNIEIYMTMGDLDFLVKNKRISAPMGFLAEKLNLKPILRFSLTGEIEPYEKAKGFTQAFNMMCEKLQQFSAGENVTYFILHPNSEEGRELEHIFIQHFPNANVKVRLPSPVVMCHGGSAIFGVGMMKQ